MFCERVANAVQISKLSQFIYFFWGGGGGEGLKPIGFKYFYIVYDETRKKIYYNGINDGVFVPLWLVLNKWGVPFCILDCLISTCFSHQEKSCTDQWLHPIAKLYCFEMFSYSCFVIFVHTALFVGIFFMALSRVFIVC